MTFAASIRGETGSAIYFHKDRALYRVLFTVYNQESKRSVRLLGG